MELNDKVLELALDNAFDHIIITNATGIIIYANKAVEQITGYSRNEIYGNTPRLWGGLMPKDYYQRMWQCLLLDKSFRGELKNRRKNGQVYEAEVRISPIHLQTQQITFYVGIERDISREKEIDRMKTEILSLVAHQLKTPIGQLNAYVDNMMSGVVGTFSPDQTSYLTHISEVVARIVHMVTNILNVSRIDRGVITMEIKTFNLTTLVEKLIEDYRPACTQKGITIEGKSSGPIYALGDEMKVVEVVSNVIDNAVKYTDQGGVTITLKELEKTVQVEITDTGLGISEEGQQLLFHREAIVSKTPSAKEGNKLGMYIVKTFLHKMKGDITVHSQVGQGSTFIISLPKAGKGSIWLAEKKY